MTKKTRQREWAKWKLGLNKESGEEEKGYSRCCSGTLDSILFFFYIAHSFSQMVNDSMCRADEFPQLQENSMGI